MHLHRKDYHVWDVDINTARHLVEELHYARGASNTATYLHGLFDIKGQCLGAAWWIPPTKAAALATFPSNWKGVLALSRLVVDPTVPTHGASFLLGASMRLIDLRRWPCLVTYADEWRGHKGQIYRATNWRYIGLTKPEPVYVRAGAVPSELRGRECRGPAAIATTGERCPGRHPKHK